LRRTSDPVLARTQLTASLVRFRALGADPWAARAAATLRAAGFPSRAGSVGPCVALTARELGIASLAASGLTNKEIGAQLFLSHRTVASMLYKVFPKLGVTTRAALRDALTVAVVGGGDQAGDTAGGHGAAALAESRGPGVGSQMTDAAT
jgi:DNA-binding CsgD family transcriptional regulator